MTVSRKAVTKIEYDWPSDSSFINDEIHMPSFYYGYLRAKGVSHEEALDTAIKWNYDPEGE